MSTSSRPVSDNVWASTALKKSKFRCVTCSETVYVGENSLPKMCLECTKNVIDKIGKLEEECRSTVLRNATMEVDNKVLEASWRSEMTKREQLEGQLRQLLHSDAWSDVVFQVHGQNMSAHRSVLSAK